MADYVELVKAIKQAGAEAVNAECPVSVCFGRVMSISPLKVLIDQKMTLGTAQLVKTKTVMGDNSLTKGDEVVLLRQQGGQKYIMIDKVVCA